MASKHITSHTGNKSHSWLEVRLPPKADQLMPRATRDTKRVTEREEPI